jgi:non-reducing end alpha-L-arabinofuranosidase
MNTGTGGETHDIMQDADGFALKSAVDAACAGTTCTVSLLYDQSGRENHLKVAKRGLTNGGMYAAMDDFETEIDVSQAAIKAGGKDVYSLYMAARQGYRQTVAGDGVPLEEEPQGLYMLADGTHAGDACCWDFGNVSPDPTRYGVMNTLFLGKAYWGRGAGSGPWYMADYEAGVWAGGTNPGDPGWGAIGAAYPPNPNNPSMRVKFALGFLKTNEDDWALRMADAATATTITTAYAGGLPKAMHNEGAIVLGVGGDNSNNSWGTFYEGAVLAGFPSDAAEQAVLMNIKAVGYED